MGNSTRVAIFSPPGACLVEAPGELRAYPDKGTGLLIAQNQESCPLIRPSAGRTGLGRGPMIAPSCVEIMEEGLPRFCRARVWVWLRASRLRRAPHDFELAVGLNLTNARSP